MPSCLREGGKDIFLHFVYDTIARAIHIVTLFVDITRRVCSFAPSVMLARVIFEDGQLSSTSL